MPEDKDEALFGEGTTDIDDISDDAEWADLEKEIDAILKELDAQEGNAQPAEDNTVNELDALEKETEEPAAKPPETSARQDVTTTKDVVREQVPGIVDVDTLAATVEARAKQRESLINEIVKKVESGTPMEYRTPALRESARNYLSTVPMSILETSVNNEDAIAVVRKVAIGEVVTSRRERVPPPPSGEPVGGNVTWGASDLSGEASDVIAAAQRIFGLTPEEIERALSMPGGEL